MTGHTLRDVLIVAAAILLASVTIALCRLSVQPEERRSLAAYAADRGFDLDMERHWLDIEGNE